MSKAQVSRRPRGEDAIYFATAKNPYVGSVSLGYGSDGKRVRRKVFGRTKQEVRDKLKALHKELNAGVKSSSTYTVREAVADWLQEGLDGTSDRTRTLYEGLLGPVLDAIGARPLRDLGPRDARSALSKLATRYSTRSLQITRNSLERAIRHAESNDLVGRNVAALVKTPKGRDGRPSKSFTLEQAKALLAASEGRRLHAYVVLSLLVGIETFTGSVAAVGSGTLTWATKFHATFDCSTQTLSNLVGSAKIMSGTARLTGLHGRLRFLGQTYSGTLTRYHPTRR